MKIGNREFKDSGKTYIMGILNVTPDSFSDGGKYNDVDRALFHVEEMIKEGADIIDIGAESTRPGYTKVEGLKELNRVVPVLRAVKRRFDVPISIDTYKAGTAVTVINEGADLINDVTGLKGDEKMAETIAMGKVACCLVHNRKSGEYNIFLRDIIHDLEESLDIAKRGGIRKDRIILDPGIGFGKSREQNLVLLKHLDELSEFSLPMLLGASKKSVIGRTLGVDVDSRGEGTLVTTALAVMHGYSFVRVHDVEANKRAIEMAEAIKYSDM